MKIKVLHWPLKNPNAEQVPTYTVTDDDKTLHVEYCVPYNSTYRSGNFDIDLNVAKKVYDIFIYEHNEFITEIVEAFAYCNRNGFTTNYPDRQKVARVVVDDRKNVFVVLISACADIKGYDNIQMDADEHPATYYIMQLSTWFTKLQDRASKKRKLIKHMDAYRSIAYLEAQVDLLTKFVLEKGTPEMKAVLEAADKESVLDIKKLEAVKKEFTENKHEVRERQKEYYNDLEKS